MMQQVRAYFVYLLIDTISSCTLVPEQILITIVSIEFDSTLIAFLVGRREAEEHLVVATVYTTFIDVAHIEEDGVVIDDIASGRLHTGGIVGVVGIGDGQRRSRVVARIVVVGIDAQHSLGVVLTRMSLIAAVGLDLDGQHPLLNHVDVVEVELDAQQAHVLAAIDLHGLRVAGKLLHILVVQVGDVGTIGRTAKALIVQGLQGVAMAYMNGQVALVAGRAGHDDRQVVVRDALSVGERSVVIVT